MNPDAKRIAEEFDRMYLEPANMRLREEAARLERVRLEMESLVARMRALAEEARATIGVQQHDGLSQHTK